MTEKIKWSYEPIKTEIAMYKGKLVQVDFAYGNYILFDNQGEYIDNFVGIKKGMNFIGFIIKPIWQQYYHSWKRSYKTCGKNPND